MNLDFRRELTSCGKRRDKTHVDVEFYTHAHARNTYFTRSIRKGTIGFAFDSTPSLLLAKTIPYFGTSFALEERAFGHDFARNHRTAVDVLHGEALCESSLVVLARRWSETQVFQKKNSKTDANGQKKYKIPRTLPKNAPFTKRFFVIVPLTFTRPSTMSASASMRTIGSII